MYLVDAPILNRAADDDGHGQNRRFTDANFMVLAQDVIQRLSAAARHNAEQHPLNLDGFCLALMEREPHGARRILMRAHDAGASQQELCTDYIAAAAKRLGARWDDDAISFGDMALATGRMLALLRDLRDLAPATKQRGDREALFATVPGEQHILGITMAANLMRERGWKIDLRVDESISNLCRIAHDNAYQIIGLSAANADRVRTLAAMVVELRLAAPHAHIFVGGRLAELEPDIATRLGADATAMGFEGSATALERMYKKLRVVEH